MHEGWTSCPDCYADKGEDHHRDCPRRKRRPLNDFSCEAATNRSPETMRGPAPQPLKPVDESLWPEGTKAARQHATSVKQND